MYMAYCRDDPTEWTLAEEVFGSWSIWERISTMQAIKGFVSDLRKANGIRMKSIAIKKIVQEASLTDGRNTFQAAKYLIDKNLAEPSLKITQGKKAKSKENIAALKLIQKDAERLQLKVFK